jgi:GT2 family glycosyltransferase
VAVTGGPAVKAALIVPTLGRSPLLAECLRALRAEAGAGAAATAELILVAQGAGAGEPGPGVGSAVSGGLVDRRLDLPRAIGFAGAVNLGIAATRAPFVAVVNDDAVVEPGWLAALLAALEAEPRAVAAQGVNLQAADPARVDGWGLGWNRWLQAVQLGHGEPPPAGGPGAPAREVFGVSGTAAVYRRQALLAAALPPRRRPPAGRAAGASPPVEVFDSRLGAYYEDADLAARLRAAGGIALSVPAARARHGGSLTAGGGRWPRVYGNRYLVAARLLGRSFWGALPRMAARDLADLGAALGGGELRRAAGVVLGWGRAAARLPAYLRTGPPLVAPAELRGAAGPPRPAEAP